MLFSNYSVITQKLFLSNFWELDKVILSLLTSQFQDTCHCTFLLMLFLEEWPWPWPPSSPWQPCSVESDTRSQKSATFHTWTSGCSCALSLSTSSCLSLSVSFSWRHPRKRLSAKLSKGRLDCCFPWPLSYSTWFTGRQCAVSSEEICKISDVVFMRNDACNLKSSKNLFNERCKMQWRNFS